MKRHTQHMKRRGFSLIEVMIGLAILLIGLASAAALSISNARSLQRSQQAIHAANLAEYKMEELRNTDFASIDTGADAETLDSLGNPGGIFTRSWTVQANTPDTGLKTVKVTVAWQQFSGTQRYEVTGVIGQ